MDSKIVVLIIIVSVLSSESLIARSGTEEKYRILQPKRQVTDQVDESPATENGVQENPPGDYPDYPDKPPGSSSGSQNGSEMEGSDGAITSGPIPPPPADPVPGNGTSIP